MHFDFLIIGGGIAGTSAAETVRAKLPDVSIAIIGTEAHRLYSRVLLPHWVREEISEEKVFLRTPDFYEQKKISYFSGVTVTNVDSVAHTVTSNGEKISYGKLLLATGGTPRRLSCTGGDDPDILFFQTLDHARALTQHREGEAIVVGGGFIALELLMSFVHHGMPTTAMVRGDCFFSRTLDQESGRRIDGAVRAHGVTIKLRTEVSGITSDRGVKTVYSGSEALRCVSLGFGLGLELTTAFLEGSGVACNRGIVVDESLRTSVADVFAAGDVAEYYDPRVERHRVVGTWANALLQGKIAALNMMGGEEKFGTVTSYGIQCFGLPVVFLGATDAAVDQRVVRVREAGVQQFFIHRDRLVGVTCVGLFPDRGLITTHVSAGKTLDEKQKAMLTDARIPFGEVFA